MNKTKRGIVAFLLVATLLFSMVVIANAMSQTWYLSAKPQDFSLMYKVSPPDKQGGNCSVITVPQPPNEIFWIANEAAMCNVTFLAGDWDMHLLANNKNTDSPFSAEIGEWNGATFMRGGLYNGSFPAVKPNWAKFTLSASTFTVHEGNWLAFRLINLHTQGNMLGITPCDSSVSSPPTDPNYPVPEMGTLILFSLGLLALVGYVVYRRGGGAAVTTIKEYWTVQKGKERVKKRR